MIQKIKNSNGSLNIECPGLDYKTTSYAKIKQEEMSKIRQSHEEEPIGLRIQRQFLRDQGKSKKAEAAWFDRLEEELERIAEDEYLLQTKQKLKLKMIEDKKKKEEQQAIMQENVGQKEEMDVEKDIDNWEEESESGARFDEQIDPSKLLKDKEVSISPSEPTAAHELQKSVEHGQSKDSESVMSSDQSVQYDPNKIKRFINKINQINMKQTEQAFKETQRNRKISSIGSIHNITIGQAYYNLNKT